ncbi:MAG: MFS transporter, partial [Chloroflexi bacterium]|nr:MFS transporter [Chloroflexota bacterium]
MAEDVRRLASTAAVSTAATDRSEGAAPAASLRNTFSSLSERNYLFLWLGMLGVMAGMQMQMLARSYLTYDITGSAILLGVVSAGNALPMLALSLFGGAFADRFDMKRIIQAGQLVFALLSLVVGIAIVTGYITWQYLLVAAVIQGATFSFMMPARQAIIPHLVSREKLTNAMALSAAGMSAMTLAAPAFAGLIYGFAGAHNVYFVISALGFGAVALTNLIPSTKGATAGKKKGPIIKDIGAGLSYIRRTPFILALLLIGLSTTVLAQPFRFLMPVFIVDIYRLGPEYMGLLVSAMGGSSLISALFVASLNKWHRGMLLIISSF